MTVPEAMMVAIAIIAIGGVGLTWFAATHLEQSADSTKSQPSDTA